MITRRNFLQGAALFAVSAGSGCAHEPRHSATAEQISALQFTDITHRTGIRFQAVNGRSPHRYFIETMGSGCAFIDYDADGWQDILLLSGQPLPGSYNTQTGPSLRLYRNNRNGTFTDVTQAVGLAETRFYAYGVAVGDFNNDGYPDFYVSCALGPGRLFENRQGKSFKDVTGTAGISDNNGLWGTSCCWLDYNNDGHLDLFVCNYVNYRSLHDDMPCKLANGVPTYCLPNAFAPVACRLYRNNGNGTFTDVTDASGIGSSPAKGLGAAVWDYDNDGLPDIFVACDTVPSLLFHNLGNGRFEEVGLQSGIATDAAGGPHSGMGIDAAQLAGSTALLIGNYTNSETCLYRETAPGLFQDEAGSNGIGAASRNKVGFGAFFADFANRGHKDVLVVNGHVQDNIHQYYPNQHYHENPLLYRGDGTGRFVLQPAAGPLGVPIVARGAAWANLFNDGRLAVLVTTNGGPAYLWQSTAIAGSWISLSLAGTRSNRSGIGAKVKLTTPDGKTQTDSCRSGSSYLSASDLRIHFGLGQFSKEIAIEVQWPSGTREEHTGLAANRVWKITEGKRAE